MSDDDPRAVAIRHADLRVARLATDAANDTRADAEFAKSLGWEMSEYSRIYSETLIGRLQAIAARLRGERA